MPAALIADVRSYFGIDDPQWQTLRRRQPWWIANFRFVTPADRALASLRGWLTDLGVRPRDLRDSPAGKFLLSDALNSDRGRNFVAQEA